jgi:ABC-2 type transport system ATP-binding protein
VTIIGTGRVLASGRVDDLVGAAAAPGVRVRVDDLSAAGRHLTAAGLRVRREEDSLYVEGADDPARITRLLAAEELFVRELAPDRRDLESVFLDLTRDDTLPAGIASDDGGDA